LHEFLRVAILKKKQSFDFSSLDWFIDQNAFVVLSKSEKSNLVESKNPWLKLIKQSIVTLQTFDLATPHSNQNSASGNLKIKSGGILNWTSTWETLALLLNFYFTPFSSDPLQNEKDKKDNKEKEKKDNKEKENQGKEEIIIVEADTNKNNEKNNSFDSLFCGVFYLINDILPTLFSFFPNISQQMSAFKSSAVTLNDFVTQVHTWNVFSQHCLMNFVAALMLEVNRLLNISSLKTYVDLVMNFKGKNNSENNQTKEVDESESESTTGNSGSQWNRAFFVDNQNNRIRLLNKKSRFS
jgi:hypothetical protein